MDRSGRTASAERLAVGACADDDGSKYTIAVGEMPVPGELLFRVTTGHVTLLRPKLPGDMRLIVLRLDHMTSENQCQVKDDL